MKYAVRSATVQPPLNRGFLYAEVPALRQAGLSTYSNKPRYLPSGRQGSVHIQISRGSSVVEQRTENPCVVSSILTLGTSSEGIVVSAEGGPASADR